MNILDVQKMIDEGVDEETIIDRLVDWLTESINDDVLEKIYGEMDERSTKHV